MGFISCYLNGCLELLELVQGRHIEAEDLLIVKASIVRAVGHRGPVAQGGKGELGLELLGPDLGLCVCHAEEGTGQGQGGAGPEAVHVEG